MSVMSAVTSVNLLVELGDAGRVTMTYASIAQNKNNCSNQINHKIHKIYAFNNNNNRIK
jgi:hypothetical protein